MAGDVANIKVCSPLKLRSGLTGKYHAICHYSYNLPFDYQTAGGEYTPTESQNKAAFELLNLNPTPEQKEACNMVCMAIPVKRKYTMILYTSSMSTYGAKNKVCSESTKSNFSN